MAACVQLPWGRAGVSSIPLPHGRLEPCPISASHRSWRSQLFEGLRKVPAFACLPHPWHYQSVPILCFKFMTPLWVHLHASSNVLQGTGWGRILRRKAEHAVSVGPMWRHGGSPPGPSRSQSSSDVWEFRSRLGLLSWPGTSLEPHFLTDKGRSTLFYSNCSLIPRWSMCPICSICQNVW